MATEIRRSRGRRAPSHKLPRPHLRTQRMSARGHTAYGPPPSLGDGAAPPMAFPTTPSGGAAMGPPDMAAGGGGPPAMGGGAPEL